MEEVSLHLDSATKIHVYSSVSLLIVPVLQFHVMTYCVTFTTLGSLESTLHHPSVLQTPYQTQHNTTTTTASTNSTPHTTPTTTTTITKKRRRSLSDSDRHRDPDDPIWIRRRRDPTFGRPHRVWVYQPPFLPPPVQLQLWSC